ncbi:MULTISPECIES: hypothetical protein [Gordonia]|uniref:Cell wall synthesis protein Wag31 n=1 Tax=Gordonia malaquae NBRC 108250 TaxID=1223542 RepID=M3VFE1_GORML|nr:hypothetical protein [Gordonia malaquae]GAC80024.1 hypothetical protein GM1_014_00160 [Gordonia malaquae NBRC 108250]SEC32851.1 hypothetical protein SAMN04488550_1650 [Gordonia malaquae]
MSAPGQRQSPFPIVMRGYDRDQVTDHIRRLDAELQMMAADRDSAHASADQLHERLEQARAQVHSLQRDVDTLSVPPTTVAGMTERVSRMLQLATDEAAELRANAREEAAETISVARQEAKAERDSAATDAARTRELAQDHADTLITDAEERAAAIDADAETVRIASEKAQADAKERAAQIIADAEDEAARLRGAAHNIAMNRLGRSREIAGAAHDAHRQILDHLGALRQHLGDLPDALALSGDELDLVNADDSDDLTLLNRTLDGRDRFVSADPSRTDTRAAEATDVLDAISDEYSDDDYDAKHYGPSSKDGADSATA